MTKWREGLPIQNIPIRSELGKRIRQAMRVAPSGLLTIDYASMELRLFAALRKNVESCTARPFVHVEYEETGPYRWTCHAKYTDTGRPLLLGPSAPNEPPPWCPLRIGPVLVTLAGKKPRSRRG